MVRDCSPSSVAQLAHSKQTALCTLLSFEHVCSGGSWAFCPRARAREPELYRSGAEQSVTAGPLPGPPQWGMQLSLSQAHCNGLFSTPAPMFIYPQALDGQTRWEPDNSNRNNGKGEQDLSLGSPPCLRSLIHTLTHVCTQTVTEHSAYSRDCVSCFLTSFLYHILNFSFVVLTIAMILLYTWSWTS